MKLSDVKEIKECYGEQDTNKCLKKGYELIRILQSKMTDNCEVVRPVYILGK